MDYTNDTTEHIKNKHLTYDERIKIEMRLKDGWSAYRIAKYELHCAANTVRNEIKRGTVLFYRGKVARYKARAGQESYEANRKNSRRPYHALERTRFLNYVTQHFGEDKWSLDSCAGRALQSGKFSREEVVCTKTLYNYVDIGLVPIKNIDLPEKLKRKPSKKRSREHKKTLGRSIEERHADVEKREEFGHWEADLVIGSKSGDDAVLLVMLEMLGWLCDELMEAEVSIRLGAEKSEHNEQRASHRSGYRPRRLDTPMGTMYLMVPKVRKGGYIPFFVTERQRSEAALISVVQEAYVQGVSTRRMEKLAASLGIESLSASQVSEMTKGLNEQVEQFRTRDLSEQEYPFIWVDALYEKIRQDGRVINMAVQVVCGVNSEGHREVLAIEPMLEESKETYTQLFASLKKRGLSGVQLVVSDDHAGLREAIKEYFTAAGWQRCKVHFMRNIMAHVPHKEKVVFAAQLKQIWTSLTIEIAKQRAENLTDVYQNRFPKAIQTLERGLEDSLQFF